MKNEICVVIQPTANPTDTNLMELLFFCDALRRAESRKVIGVLPYFGYGRQDVAHSQGECVSVNVVIRFLETIGFAKIYTVNLHNKATEGAFTIPFKNISAFNTLALGTKKLFPNLTQDNAIVVAPDHGGIRGAREFGEAFFGTEQIQVATCEKKRDYNKIHKSSVLDLHGDVAGKTAILVDDVVSSGGTLMKASELCKARGATRVLAVCVHHDFSPGVASAFQNSSIEMVISSNSIDLPEKDVFPKLHEVSLAGLIADEIRYLLT